jgi:hypothetical protein
VLVCQVDNIISDKELLVTWWLPDDFLPNALLLVFAIKGSSILGSYFEKL